jgi:hypothetical protein
MMDEIDVTINDAPSGDMNVCVAIMRIFLAAFSILLSPRNEETNKRHLAPTNKVSGGRPFHQIISHIMDDGRPIPGNVSPSFVSSSLVRCCWRTGSPTDRTGTGMVSCLDGCSRVGVSQAYSNMVYHDNLCPFWRVSRRRRGGVH